MSNSDVYTGTGFSHRIPFSLYESKTREEILEKYENTSYEKEITGVCTYVTDGDTIWFKPNGEEESYKVRLVGVNTPEKSAEGYECSKSFTHLLCDNQEISINVDSEKEEDNYGRKLAVVIVDNKNLNEILLKEGLAEVMYIPPSEFSPNEWTLQDEIPDGAIQLNSTIINQKKRLFLYVTQSKNLVWPNQTYDYQIYLKNISGQTVENIKIYITNPKEVVIEEDDESSQVYAIPTLKTGQSVLINLNDCLIMQEGYYNVTFVAMGDETEIKTQTLLIKCGYENDNKNIIHRIAFYNFSPYENAYMQKSSDFNENVTQLTKVQTKPFEAYNQPFEMDTLELDLYAQDMFLTNTDDIPSMYLGRENWESNLKETFVGQSLSSLIHKINKESDIVDIDFLRTGNNEMFTDFQRIFPNGFIHRFGLLKSEFYKLLGIIPNVYSINDDLFRWARTDSELVVYPKRENDKWNQKPWCGTGYYIYESKIENDKKIYTIEKAIFTKKEDAEIYVENLNTFNSTHFIDNIIYEIRKRDWLPGIFYVEIPLRDIPANFVIPSVDQIQSIIELTKPYGLKGYPRFALYDNFNHQMEFNNIPNVSPHISIDCGNFDIEGYHIRGKKYQEVIEDNNQTIQLKEYGLQAEFAKFDSDSMNLFSYYPKSSICKQFIQNIKYFIEDNKPYAHIYPLERKEELSFAHIDVKQTTYDNLIDILQNDIIKAYGLYWNANIDGAIVENISDEPTSAYTEEKIYIKDFYEKNTNLPNEFFVVIDNFDNSISVDMNQGTIQECPSLDTNENEDSYNMMNISEKTIISCNQQDKSFDGKSAEIDSLNQLLMKNPEDISYYLINNSIFDKDALGNTVIPSLTIPAKYKTLNYYDENTSMVLDFTQQEFSAIRLYKQQIPEHVNINLLLTDKSTLKEHILSYKLLYDDVYQISYKTFKKSEIIVKEIVTQFDYLLYDINNISPHKDLIKIYYGLEDKIYFMTAFVANILEGTGYKVRVSLTNDLTLPSVFEFSNGALSFGRLRNIINENNSGEEVESQEYVNWYLSNKKYSNIISTDNYQITEIPKTTTLWQNLYRINKDETSFTIFENEASEKTPINDIELFLTDLNIPANSIIDNIYLDIYADSRDEVFVSSSYQTNTNIINDTNDISTMLEKKDYQIYTKNNLKYLYQQLAYYQEHENDKEIEYYKMLIDTHNRQNQNVNIDFSQTKPMKISNSYWNEVSFNTTSTLNIANVKTIYLILEGYNYSNDVIAEAQLVNYDGIENTTKININTGYFYKKIPINYNTKYSMDDLNIRFKFKNIHNIDLYNVKSEIHFSAKQDVIINSIDGDTFSINGINKYSCHICKNIDGDNIINGLTIKLSFGDVQNYLKIYSVVANIVYHEKAFTNVIEISPDFNSIHSDESSGIFRCNVFDEKVSDMRQDSYTTKKPNGEYDAGFEVDNRIYQAFVAEEDNVTSIELKPNGKIGAPDKLLKVAILDNYDNLPNNILKEVIVDVTKNKLIDGEAYKYNIYVDNLVVGNTYWFSIEPVDKTKQGARRFFYNNHQVGDFKLLRIHDGDVINQHASLYFRLYSKQNDYSFNQLPYKFNIENDYTKDINLVTEIQILDGYIKNIEQSLFTNCFCNDSVQDNNSNITEETG